MDRSSVSKRRAMRVSVSPGFTRYVRNEGPGLGVGRAKVEAGVGPATVALGFPATALRPGPPSSDGNRPGARTTTAIAPSTTTMRTPARIGESRAERERLGRTRRGGAYIIAVSVTLDYRAARRSRDGHRAAAAVLARASIGVGGCNVNSPASASPSEAAATRPPPARFATKRA